MDAAEAWLVANDPDYQRSRAAWGNLDENGEYKPPWQEVPVGSSDDVARLVDAGDARYAIPSEDICDHCHSAFAPSTVWQEFCSEECQQRARTRSRAEYMRDYRARQKAA